MAMAVHGLIIFGHDAAENHGTDQQMDAPGCSFLAPRAVRKRDGMQDMPIKHRSTGTTIHSTDSRLVQQIQWFIFGEQQCSWSQAMSGSLGRVILTH